MESGGRGLAVAKKQLFLLPSTAVGADARDERAVAGWLELVLFGRLADDPFELAAVEFDQPVADLAVQMVVARVAVLMFVDTPAGERHLADQTGFGQFAERAIDGRTAHFAPGDQLLQVVHQLVGVEMIVMAENHVDDGLPLPGHSLVLGRQELGKPFAGRLRHLYAAERIVLCHDKNTNRSRRVTGPRQCRASRAFRTRRRRSADE